MADQCMINGVLKQQLEEYFLIDFSVWSELFSILIDSYEMCVCGGGRTLMSCSSKCHPQDGAH